MIKQHPFKLTVCLGITLFVGAVWAIGQDEPATEQTESGEQQVTAPQEAAPEESPFVLPEGDVEALFAFMTQVQQTRPPETMKTQEAFKGFLRQQVAAVLKACDRIDTLEATDEQQMAVIRQRVGAWTALSQVDEDASEKLDAYFAQLAKDERPAVRKMVSFRKITSTTQQFFTLSAEQREQLVTDIVSHLDEFGFDQGSLQLCDQLGNAFGRTESPQPGAILFERLVTELKKANNPELEPHIVRFEGSARRLKLPGNFMEVMGTTADGKEFDWDAYRGKVVLVDFWATWCGPCRQQIPNMKAQLEKYGDKGFAIVGISLDETIEQYQSFIDNEELTWVNLMSQNEDERGWSHPLVGHYGISGIPAAFLVDQEGKVVSMEAVGSELNRLLDEMLGDTQDAG